MINQNLMEMNNMDNAIFRVWLIDTFTGLAPSFPLLAAHKVLTTVITTL